MQEETIKKLRHKRLQRLLQKDIYDRTGYLLVPIEPSVSLNIQERISELLESLRRENLMNIKRFTIKKMAISEFIKRASYIDVNPIISLYLPSKDSSFYEASKDIAFYNKCLANNYESIVLVEKKLDRGVLFDNATDDPECGDFFEIEWWNIQ